MPVPWVVPDELVHSELARAFAATGQFAVRDEPFSPRSWGPLYLISIAPAFRLADSLPRAYLIVKAINCLMMSTAAVPAYFLARRLLDRRSALILALLAVLVPSGIYTARVQAESLAYPFFLLAILAGVAMIERPGAKREFLGIGAILLAVLARAQFVVLFPALAWAAVLVAGLDERDAAGRVAVRPVLRRLGAYRIAPALVVLVGIALVAVAVSGGSASGLAGGHAEAFGAITWPAVARSLLLHLAALDLYVGMVPLAALLILGVLSVRRAGVSRELRVFCAVSITLVGVFTALSAWYLVAVYPGSYLRVYDRYEFYVVPLVLIGFLVWIRDGMPRIRGAGVLVALLGVLVPVSRLMGHEAWTRPNALAFLPWARIGNSWLVYGSLVVGGTYLAYLFLRSQDGDWLIALVAANFVLVNLFAQSTASHDSRLALRQGLGSEAKRSWIDDAVGAEADVTVLWSGGRRGSKAWSTIWENELLNQSVGHVYDLREKLPYDLPEPRLQVQGQNLYLPSGRPLRAHYVLTDLGTPVIGEQVAVNRATGMILRRVEGAVRLR
jgi:hypothetical protein